MKKEIRTYAAGLIDGEGTVTLVRQTRHQKRSPVVSVSSTTKELVDFCKETFGGHIIQLAPPKKKHWKQAWHWQITHNGAIAVLEQITPYLREPKKRARAQLILSEYKMVVVRNGKYTQDQLAKKEDFDARFFDL